MAGVSEDRKVPEPEARQHDGPTARLLHRGLGALGGLIAGFSALAVAELAAAAVRPEASPVTAVGGAFIDRTPPWLKDFAVRNFGTNDKLVLQLGIVIVLALLAMTVGVFALHHRRAGSAAVLVFGAIGAVAAVSRPGGGPVDALPSLVGAVVACGVLYLLAGALALRPSPAAGGTDGTFDRRRFVIAATAAVAASAGAGALGRGLNASGSAGAVASRKDVVLPPPASPARPVPAGADLRIRGLSPFTTPNKDFYRVDTALVVPRVDATGWRLKIHGKGVTRPLTVTFDDLLRRELIERDITLTCVSNEVGGPYVGNARWIGVRLADLLREAGVRPPSKGGPADQLVSRSVDGMTIGSPVETVMDGRDALLAIGMNGEPLPFDHGFPVRMVVPGLYGYVSACKWIQDLELTTFADYDAYWVKRSWSQEAPIKTESRIDTPRPFASPKPGTVPVAGVAWAQHRGIARVEVRVDGGPWHTARLAAQDTRDTWRQWVWEWPATTGNHTLEVRATDQDGYTQTGKRVGTVPNGATGWHSVVVAVT
ncbi:molybdopterin-dependent oxidoreductase [Streptomyces sp. JV176]|uniref:molybdopterin-dependent oxidoreductase n=1 Tax=Streptomyces sp. JV176 TaxID=858630 RepID=UPI002E76ED8D|nr:molybdopterin-dependent oxidoreductase [Streptomyces sp. JV176]MEE1800102.1 molybdopterin-dependent oxidoreductase [Streptomyces sp. JV176]